MAEGDDGAVLRICRCMRDTVCAATRHVHIRPPSGRWWNRMRPTIAQRSWPAEEEGPWSIDGEAELATACKVVSYCGFLSHARAVRTVTLSTTSGGPREDLKCDGLARVSWPIFPNAVDLAWPWRCDSFIDKLRTALSALPINVHNHRCGRHVGGVLCPLGRGAPPVSERCGCARTLHRHEHPDGGSSPRPFVTGVEGGF